MHGFLQQRYDVFMVVAPGNVEGWAESTQAELVGKVDDDLYTLQVIIIAGIVDGEPGCRVSDGGVGTSTA